MKLIDKDAIVREIEKRLKALANTSAGDNKEFAAIIGAQQYELMKLAQYIDTLEVKEVDLGKELDNYFDKFNGLEKNNWNWRIDSINVHAQGIYDFAEHFFELGLKSQKGE